MWGLAKPNDFVGFYDAFVIKNANRKHGHFSRKQIISKFVDISGEDNVMKRSSAMST